MTNGGNKEIFRKGNVIKLRSLKQKSPLLFDEQRTFNLDIYPYKLKFDVLKNSRRKLFYSC